MSNLVDTLATRCVLTKEAMLGADVENPQLRQMRAEFDKSVARETALRHHAQRLRDLSESESKNEPSGAWATIRESLARLLPIPRSISETAIRAPVIGGSALVGRHLFRSHDDPALWNMAKSPIESIKDYQKHWSAPELPSQSFEGRHLNDPQHPDYRPSIQGHSLGMRGAVGTLAGIATGSILSGIPYAIGHAIKKTTGGESSWDTRKHMNDAEYEASQEALKREKMLANMPTNKIEKMPASARLNELKKAASVVKLIRQKVREHANA